MPPVQNIDMPQLSEKQNKTKLDKKKKCDYITGWENAPLGKIKQDVIKIKQPTLT